MRDFTLPQTDVEARPTAALRVAPTIATEPANIMLKVNVLEITQAVCRAAPIIAMTRIFSFPFLIWEFCVFCLR